MNDLPWTEKHRPHTVQELVQTPLVLSQLQTFAASGSMPNLVFAGPPGTGKTTAVCCLARAVLGEHFGTGFLELNASESRSLDTVRTRVKGFAQSSAVPWKVVALDEVDNMTRAAQQALRRIMEVFSADCRFVFTCNVSSKLIEALQSRCSVVRFGRLSDTLVTSRLETVVAEEGLSAVPGVLSQLAMGADGDMRKAVALLQQAAFSRKKLVGEIGEKEVALVLDISFFTELRSILVLAKDRKFEQAVTKLEALFRDGRDSRTLIDGFAKSLDGLEIEENNEESVRKYGLLCGCVTECYKDVVDAGITNKIRLYGMLAEICKIQ